MGVFFLAVNTWNIRAVFDPLDGKPAQAAIITNGGGFQCFLLFLSFHVLMYSLLKIYGRVRRHPWAVFCRCLFL